MGTIDHLLVIKYRSIDIKSDKNVLFLTNAGPVGEAVALLFFFNRNISSLAFPLSISQSIMYKCLLIFKWKKCAAMDDDFWGTYLGMVNILLGVMIGTIRIVLGNLYHKGFEILSGVKTEDKVIDTEARLVLTIDNSFIT